MTRVYFIQNPTCLNITLRHVCYPFLTAYLIYVYTEWLAYLCLGCHIVFLSNLFSCFFYMDILCFCKLFSASDHFLSLSHQLIALFQTSIFLAISATYTSTVSFTGYCLRHGRLWYITLFCFVIYRKIDHKFWVCCTYFYLRMSQCLKTLLDFQNLVLLCNKWRYLFPLSHTFIRITGSLCENS